ncbi:MAG TPA: murein biosynthesis integral membrane protein MurJ [Alphaproteobacteria bacterium]|nr:murein biosynthesis integral membrane protein MurJ [Alphaproteobacteria bacterium]
MALLRFSFTVGFYTLLSRILGFARDILIARYLGSTGVVEAFVVALRFPNLFRRLVGEGAFTAAFVPMFSRRLEGEGRPGALAFADQSFAVLVAGLLVFTVLGEIFMPWLMYAIAPGFGHDPALFDLAVLFTRITLPYLMCMALLALYSGMLNSIYRFAAAAAVPILFNIILIGAMVIARSWFPTPGHALAWAVALAGFAQLLWIVVVARRAGLALRLPRPRLTPEVRQLLRLMVPGAIGAGVSQINLLIGTIIATFIPGAVSFLYFADRVYQFPLGIIGVAIGTALLPDLSRKLVRDPASAMDVQNRAIEIALLFTLPAAATMLAIPESLSTILFQYGAFSRADAAATGGALAAFAVGLPGYVMIRVLTPGFFARHDTTRPVYYAIVGVLVNVALSLALVWSLRHVGIALATAVAAWVNAALLAAALARRGHLVLDAGLRRRLPRLVLAAVAMGAALVPTADRLEALLTGGAPARILALAVFAAVASVVYFGLVFLLRAADTSDFKALLRRRRPAPTSAPGS